MKPDPTNTPNAKQVDDNVQNSALGAVKPLAEHPGSGRLVPVSAATPDAEPKAERKMPPQKTGHDIGPDTATLATPNQDVGGSSTTPATELIDDPEYPGKFITEAELKERRLATGAYRGLPQEVADVKKHDEVVQQNAEGAAEDDQRKVADPQHPMEVAQPLSDPPFPRATPGLPKSTDPKVV